MCHVQASLDAGIFARLTIGADLDGREVPEEVTGSGTGYTSGMDDLHIRAAFAERFGHEPTVVAVAPGRINLIGEHTDYNEGFVFPVAINRQTWVAALPTEGSSSMFSTELGSASDFNLTSVAPGQLEDWGKYPAGMGWALRQGGRYTKNVEAIVSSDIPMGSGVSSSAALEMAFGQVWNRLGELGIGNAELAGLGKVCENRFVGVNSGIMDQMASAMGKAGKAMFLDTRTLKIEYASVPDGLSVVLCDTKKPRALTSSAYNERRAQCEAAAKILGVVALRDATLGDLAAKRDSMDDVTFRRARHVISENERCLLFRNALAAGDLNRIGVLMNASHASLRDDYEVSCFELDRMAEAAWDAPGCVGARMTGAGFGGACVALVQTSHVAPFIEATLASYDAASGRIGEAMACSIVDGARVID